jgi:exodeoxyribonuclease-1
MSFLWHDYETFGTHPAHDRPCQFAAIRTNDQLEPVGEPLSFYCQPPTDALPHPFACLVTGISPQHAQREGVNEARFATRINHEMMEPGTCSVGYNSLRFDDEVSRHLFYRNFFDPYEREYKNGNSRWDLIGLVRMCYALRPQGIEWPMHDDGKPSFRLEDLTAANGIGHQGAHDALADVRATLDLARLLRRAQPRLFTWALEMRNQEQLRQLLDTQHPQMLVHTSGRIPAVRGCTSLVLPLDQLPERRKSVIVVDLMTDPGPLLALDAGDIRDRLFTPAVDLPEGVERIPLKTIAINRCPMLAPAAVLRDTDTDRIGLDVPRCQRHADLIRQQLPALRSKLLEVYQPAPLLSGQDPESMLYSGNFFSPHDRRLMERLRQANPQQLAAGNWPFQDARLPEMLFRYRARNYPDSLSVDEFERWEQQRLQRLHEPTEEGQLGFAAFQQQLEEARLQASDRAPAQALLDQVEAWALELAGER